MNIQIKEKKEEPLLSRTKVNAQLEFENATPSYAEITTGLSRNLKTEEKLIVIRNVYTSFGHKKADVTAYVYSNEEKKHYVEPKVKDKKAKEGQAPKK